MEESYLALYLRAVNILQELLSSFFEVENPADHIKKNKPIAIAESLGDRLRVRQVGDDFIVLIARIEKHIYETNLERHGRGTSNERSNKHWIRYLKKAYSYSFMIPSDPEYKRSKSIISIPKLISIAEKNKIQQREDNKTQIYNSDISKSKMQENKKRSTNKRKTTSPAGLQNQYTQVDNARRNSAEREHLVHQRESTDEVRKIKNAENTIAKSNTAHQPSILESDLVDFLNKYTSEKNPFSWKKNLTDAKLNPVMIDYAPERGAWIPVKWVQSNYLVTIKPRGFPRYVVPIGRSVNNSQVREWYEVEGSGEKIKLLSLAKAMKTKDNQTTYRLDGDKGRIRLSS